MYGDLTSIPSPATGLRDSVRVLQNRRMSHTITVRLTPELAEWLEATSKESGLPQGRIVRQQLEKAKASADKRFMRLAGSIEGPRDLSRRKGFSKK
jgi:hypothetical protein